MSSHSHLNAVHLQVSDSKIPFPGMLSLLNRSGQEGTMAGVGQKNPPKGLDPGLQVSEGSSSQGSCREFSSSESLPLPMPLQAGWPPLRESVALWLSAG